jgi:ribosomal protein S18 acetylase RimI-like enzyme
MRPAVPADAPVLVGLMREFYAEAGHGLDARQAREAFEALLDEPRLGRVWLIEQRSAVGDSVPSATARMVTVLADGYVVVTFVFAMEYGGQVAVIDDFYVRPAARGRGLGTAAIAEVRRTCAALGMRALRVEVGADNAVARALYRSAGLVDLGHQLMALPLAEPFHTT